MLHTIICSAVRIYQTPSNRYWQYAQSLSYQLVQVVVYWNSHAGKYIAILKWFFSLLNAKQLDYYRVQTVFKKWAPNTNLTT